VGVLAVAGHGRPELGRALGRLRREVEEEVVAPVEGGALLDAEAAAVALVRAGRVGVALPLRERAAEEAAPGLPRRAQQLGAHPVADHLEEAPLPARGGDGLGDGGAAVRRQQRAEIDDRNAHVRGLRGLLDCRCRRRGHGGAVARRLDVAARDDGQAALGQRLHADDGLRPLLHAVRHLCVSISSLPCRRAQPICMQTVKRINDRRMLLRARKKCILPYWVLGPIRRTVRGKLGDYGICIQRAKKVGENTRRGSVSDLARELNGARHGTRWDHGNAGVATDDDDNDSCTCSVEMMRVRYGRRVLCQSKHV
jgi:hypothetical protein